METQIENDFRKAMKLLEKLNKVYTQGKEQNQEQHEE